MNPIILNVVCGVGGAVLGAIGMAAIVIWRMDWLLDIRKWRMEGTRHDGSSFVKEGLYIGKETYHRVR
jgi:hypothetical protein